MTPSKLLIVDDETVLCQSLKIEFEDDGFQVGIADSGEAAMACLADLDPAVVLLDLRLPGMNGIEVLKRIHVHDPDMAVIIMTAFGDTRTTVEAVKCGAFHFINKPFELEELKKRVAQAIKGRVLKREVEYLRFQQRKIYRFCDFVGQSDRMMDIYRQIETLAQADRTTVLVLGESGTGKELVASAIHYKSRRNKAPFMEINCASLPETLIESELFGYEKGAFTDAKQSKKGLLEMADKGTVFLDEIGEMPLSIQAKLLIFLEKKKFKRLGSGKDISVDVRIIAATNQDLVRAIEKKAFRKDLFYRLNVVSIHTPPLRDRPEDILPLSNYFLQEFSKDMGKPARPLSREVAQLFEAWPWYGNVRELRNAIERAVIFCRGDTVGKELLPREMQDQKAASDVTSSPLPDPGPDAPLDTVLLRTEERLIREALERADGNKSLAARRLGISRYSLNRRLNKFRNRAVKE